MPGFPVLHHLSDFAQTHIHCVKDAIQNLISVTPFFSRPQSFPGSRSFPMSQLCASGGQVLEFQLQHHSFQWTPRLISFRMDRLDLLAVQVTLKSLFQHHSSKASILRRAAFFTVQLSHPYMTTGKTIALTRWTFEGSIKVSELIKVIRLGLINKVKSAQKCERCKQTAQSKNGQKA